MPRYRIYFCGLGAPVLLYHPDTGPDFQGESISTVLARIIELLSEREP